ncbi:aspartate/glutamate racemase family protein [Herbiconiux sp. L3-i23]|uniref:aspartate/glutamate racemase family protein n=1 Tax=Herbiconiux sp. L3-i23 TaxID=2905871 RepID=UPI0020674BBF|nr:aspartate/glutamate racemase family protein [Herbiconiux sp. L3-i23]BDI22191.1 aspartate racemase [Herbiconiux sp. L3-i23]
MQTIGFIGGMSWESTALLYSLVNKEVAARLGGYHSARILLTSVDFADIETLQAAGRWEEAGALLADEARRLERAGADFLVLCTNTMHKVASSIEDAVGIPLVHLGDATADAILAKGVQKVGLLGTRFTMEQDFYVDRIAAKGIEVIVPDSSDREVVHRVIYDELVHGIVSADSRRAYQRVIESLVRHGAQGIVLGCTEIELLIGDGDTDVPVFATTKIHALAAVDRALALH